MATFESVEILATSEHVASLMAEAAKAHGENVIGKKVWTGPVPKGSYVNINPLVRMATPEFYFLRMANMMDHELAVLLGAELMTVWCTHLTSKNVPVGTVERNDEPHTTYGRLRNYLMQIKDEPEGRKALAVLKESKDATETYDSVMEIRFKQ